MKTNNSQRSVYWLLLQLLERKDRIRFSICLFFILIATGLELLSLGMVIPVVQVVLGGAKLEKYGWIPDAIEDMRYQTFVIVLLGALVGAFVLKNAFLVVSNYYQQRAQLSLGNRITQQLFENYLKQPYEYHLTNSSSVLLRNVTEYSGAVLFFLGPSLILLGDIFTGIGFLIVLLIVQPVSTITIGLLFGVSSWIILRVTRPKAKIWGEQRMSYRVAINNALLAGFGGVKEIKLFGRDREVIEVHRNSLYGVSRTVYMFNVVQAIPRAMFEILAVLSVAMAIVVSRLRGEPSDQATLIIALFGVVAFRMLPSINRIIVSLQQIALTRPGLEGAVEGLGLTPQRESSANPLPLGAFTSLDVVDLKYRYPNTQSDVLNLDHLRVKAGESIGIVGSSGSGKSTLVDVVIGILTPTSGQISINGSDLSEIRRSWQDKIGYVPQQVYLMDTTIRRNVAFGLPEKAISDEQVERALRQANLLEFVQTLPNGWDTEVGERGVRLSGGQRQRLGIARALYGNPEVIVLDEATSALDAATEREIVESFREIAHDHTLIVVAHRTSTLKYCSRLIRLEEGRIVQEGSFEEVIGSLPESNDKGQ
jgi:ABC-type multidrug transport system fused ATPase/permease subunit